MLFNQIVIKLLENFIVIHQFLKTFQINHFKITFRNLNIKKIHQHYTEFIKDYQKENKFHGNQLALFNEAGYLEISIYKGSKNNGAKTLFGLDIGEKIYVEFSKLK